MSSSSHWFNGEEREDGELDSDERTADSTPRSTTPLHVRLRRPLPKQPALIASPGQPPRLPERNVHRRPVFVNGAEVGYAYGEAVGERGRLHATGIALIAWHFLSRGHDTKVFLPRCYKRFADGTIGFDALRRMEAAGLVQWTMGQRSEKYAELGRVLAANARRFGGCIVGTSNMRRIYEENPVYRFVITRRLLVPTFLPGNMDIVFPLDGPEGRNGHTHERTLLSMDGDPDHHLAMTMQMCLRYQARALAAIQPCLPQAHIYARVLAHVQALAQDDS